MSYKVTYKKDYKIKEGRKWVSKTSVWDEYVKSEGDAKLRALALNWEILSLESLDDIKW